MTLAGFLRKSAHRHGFSAAVQETAHVAARLRAGDHFFARSIMTEEEWPLYARLRGDKRRIEWLSGRLAARRAVLQHTGAGGDCGVADVPSVLGGADRPPYIGGHPGLHVSISHSHGYAVAVVAGYAIGVDIEKIERRPRSLADYFCSEEECALLGAGPPGAEDDELITRLWSRKEALAKFLGLGGELVFRDLNVTRDRVHIPGRSPAWARLVSGVTGAYCVALALDADAAGDERPDE